MFQKGIKPNERCNFTSAPHLPASSLSIKDSPSPRRQHLQITLSARWRVYCVCVTQLSQSCVWLSEQKHNNNRYPLLPLSPPTSTLYASALCLAWQQREVNRMNKTYLNQSPLPWEMSSCQYSLMGKHRAGSQWLDGLSHGTYRTRQVAFSCISQIHKLWFASASSGLSSRFQTWTPDKCGETACGHFPEFAVHIWRRQRVHNRGEISETLSALWVEQQEAGHHEYSAAEISVFVYSHHSWHSGKFLLGKVEAMWTFAFADVQPLPTKFWKKSRLRYMSESSFIDTTTCIQACDDWS